LLSASLLPLSAPERIAVTTVTAGRVAKATSDTLPPYALSMSRKATLLAYLAEPIRDLVDAHAVARTYITKSDAETSDDRPIGALGIPASLTDQTSLTEDDKDTFDETRWLGYPDSLLGSTNVTRVDRETYDDNPMSVLGIPGVLLTRTDGTRNDNETFDDDPGLGPIAIPSFQ